MTSTENDAAFPVQPLAPGVDQRSADGLSCLG